MWFFACYKTLKLNNFVAHFGPCSIWATNTDTKKGYHCYDNPHFQYFTLFMGWKMGLEPTTLGTTILYSNQLSYIHHLDLITQIGCKYRVFIVSLQIYLQKFSENNRYPIYNYSQTTADGTSPSHRSPSPAPQPYSHCLPAHPPPACCVHRPCNIPQ